VTKVAPDSIALRPGYGFTPAGQANRRPQTTLPKNFSFMCDTVQKMSGHRRTLPSNE